MKNRKGDYDYAIANFNCAPKLDPNYVYGLRCNAFGYISFSLLE
jgi:hypothetical protein